MDMMQVWCMDDDDHDDDDEWMQSDDADDAIDRMSILIWTLLIDDAITISNMIQMLIDRL